MENKQEWIKLLIGDDWGFKYYRRVGHKTPFGTYGARTDGRTPLTSTPLVRFPDGTEERVPMTVQPSSTSVYDHGHTYEVNSALPVFTKDVAGTPVTLTFDKVEVLASEWAGP